MPLPSRSRRAAFTLVEVLVATAVLLMLVVLIGQLFNQATSIVTLGGKRMDNDGQARGIFDRMAVDFDSMVRRPDVDVFLKSPADPQPGNDQLAFFATAPGYYPPTGAQSPLSLVGYRLSGDKARLERLGKGLLWNGEAGPAPMVYLPATIRQTWPAATDQAVDNDYEPFGPQVFRFEYGYVLKGATLPDGSAQPSIPSDTPWDTRPGVEHAAASGLDDVAAIVVYLAVIDPRSRVLASDADMQALAGAMGEFSSTQAPGDLEKQWQAAVDASALPPAAKSSIRIYRRSFSLNK